MIMRAQVFQTVSGTFKDEKNQDTAYHQLQAMDLDAPVKEIINLKVKPELLALAQTGMDKVANIFCSFSAKAGKVSFHGYAVTKA